MNRPVLYNPYQHIAQQFVTLADAIGSTDVPTVKRLVSPTPLRLPPLMLRPGELETARDGALSASSVDRRPTARVPVSGRGPAADPRLAVGVFQRRRKEYDRPRTMRWPSSVCQRIVNWRRRFSARATARRASI